ncbi:hypothetical protein ACK3YM_14680 [Aeromonas caviae]
MENKDIVIEGDSNISPEEFDRMLLKHLISLHKHDKLISKINEIKSAIEVVKPYLSDNEFDELGAKLSRAVVKERYGE